MFINKNKHSVDGISKGLRGNDMQMLPSVSKNSNWVGGQKNIQFSSSDSDTSIDNTLWGREERKRRKWRRWSEEGEGNEPQSNISNEDHNQTYCLTGGI